MKIATPTKETGEDELLLTPTHPSVDGCTHARSPAGLNLVPTSFLVAQIVLIVCYTALAAILIASFKPQIALSTSKSHDPKITRLGELTEVESPAREALEPEIKRYFVDSARYFGDPGEEVDTLWHDVLEPMNSRVSQTELLQVGATSIHLQKSDGFLVQLGVFHELHCLKILRHWLFRESYHQGKSEAELEMQKDHCDHCLQLFFDAARCKGDTALTTFRWAATDPRPAAVFKGEHQCVKWDKLFAWAEERSVDKDEMASLVSPKYHNSSIFT